jgi:serine/threonine-protein kinase RsbW
MPPEPTPWSLTIPSDLRLLALARAFVEAVCQVAGLNETHTHAVVLATDEATNNVMRHAHRHAPDKILQIQCLIHPDALEIRIADEGPAFDLETVPHFDPAELRAGGRGVFLMRRLMDELEVIPRGAWSSAIRPVRRPPDAFARSARFYPFARRARHPGFAGHPGPFPSGMSCRSAAISLNPNARRVDTESRTGGSERPNSPDPPATRVGQDPGGTVEPIVNRGRTFLSGRPQG